MKNNKKHLCIRKEFNGPVVRIIEDIHRYSSGHITASKLIKIGERDLTVFQNCCGRVTQILEGKWFEGWYTGDGDNPLFNHNPDKFIKSGI